MKYTDLNREIDVGSSGHLMEFGSFKVLVDCGLHPKKMGFEALPLLSKIGAETLDFIAVTHSHLDHCGALPVLAASQNHAEILTGGDNVDLLFRLLRNSRSVMGKQREEYGIKEYPLFDYSSIDALRSRISPMPHFHSRKIEAGGDVAEVSFYPAGHVAGSSSVLFEHKRRRIFFTGDISFRRSGIMMGAKPPEGKFDTMVIETTRGGRDREVDFDREVDRFVDSVGRVIDGGGSVLIPVFALGRMQEILKILHDARSSGKLSKETPIFSAGLGVELSELFVKLSKKTPWLNFAKQYLDPVKSFTKKINPGEDFDEKGIYLLGSGMMVERTPSWLAASALMESRSNAIFFVGYCDPDTPGGRLLRTPDGGAFSFRELSHVGTLNCRVDKFDLSAHADRRELLDFVLEKEPRNLILTHGSLEAREWFMFEIMDISPNTNVIIPEPGETVEL